MKLVVTLLCLLHFLMPTLSESLSNYIVPITEEFTLSCPLYHEPSSRPKIYWFLPTKQIVTANYSDDTFQTSDYPSVNLTIRSITLETFGVYYCLAVYPNQTLEMASLGINVGVTLWHLRYKSKFITGLIVAACFFVILSAFCLINECQYKEPTTTVINLNDPRLHAAYENCSFSLEDLRVDSPATEEKTTKNLSTENLEENNSNGVVNCSPVSIEIVDNTE